MRMFLLKSKSMHLLLCSLFHLFIFRSLPLRGGHHFVGHVHWFSWAWCSHNVSGTSMKYPWTSAETQA
jgi:hypothetical protein